MMNSTPIDALAEIREELQAARLDLNLRLDKIAMALDALDTQTVNGSDDTRSALDLTETIENRLRTVQMAVQRHGAVDGISPLEKQRDVLAKSDLFDAKWYLDAYQDLDEATVDPVEHYILTGAYEGRNPGPVFSTMNYYRANPDVSASGWPALVHYELFGRAEARALNI